MATSEKFERLQRPFRPTVGSNAGFESDVFTDLAAVIADQWGIDSSGRYRLPDLQAAETRPVNAYVMFCICTGIVTLVR
jgi:hypothetical protein